MSSHYKLKATIGGTEVVGESLELTGNKSFKVFPVEKNETKIPIRGSAVVSILGKNHSISLNHKINENPDPDPSATKYSYIMNMYVSGSTHVSDADKENQDTAYIMASCGKTTYDSSGHTTQKIIISDAYTTQAAVRAAVGDFSSYAGGVEYNRGSIMTLITFVMYYKFAEESGGVVVPPPVPDEDTPASHRKRIPCRPSTYSNDWIVNGSISYIVDFKATESGTWERRFFRVWDDFIAFWDSICTNTTDYYDMVFSYIYEGTVEFNSDTKERVGPLTITEIDNGKGEGIHGARNLYLIPAQQEGFIKYHAAAVPCETYMQDNEGYWGWNKYAGWKLAQHRLLESDLQTEYYKGAIQYTPKFRISNSSSGNRAPGNICEPDRDNKAKMDLGNGSGVRYVYTGQAFIFALYSDTPLGKEAIPFKPYFNGENKLNHNSAIDLLGQQCFNPFRTDGQEDGKYKVYGRDDKTQMGWFSGPVEGGNKGYIYFNLLPVALYATNPNTGNRYVHTVKDPVLMNHCIRYLNYESAITQVEINEGHYAPYTNWKGSVAEPRSQATLFGESWEGTYAKSDNLKYIESVLLLPVLYTDFIIEDDHSYFGPGGAAHTHDAMGRLWFSPGVDDNQLTESVIRQMHVNIPTFEYR